MDGIGETRGVKDKTGEIVGLSSHDIRTFSSMVGNVASNIRPPIFVVTEVVTVDEKKVLIVEIPQGTDKPYCDNKGILCMLILYKQKRGLK